MSWPNRECCYLCPLQSHSLFPFICRIHFSCTRWVLSHQNSSTHKFPRFSLRNLYTHHFHCVLFRFHCNEHSLLLSSYLFRIGRIKNPSCCACSHSFQNASYLILHCPAMNFLRCLLFGDSWSIYDLWSKAWGLAWLLELHGLPPCPIPWKVLGNNNTTKKLSK